MVPTWVGVVSALSLAIIALAAIVVAVASVVSALGIRTFTRALEQIAGPAIQDVRQLIGTIKGEADALVGTSREIRLRIMRAATPRSIASPIWMRWSRWCRRRWRIRS